MRLGVNGITACNEGYGLAMLWTVATEAVYGLSPCFVPYCHNAT